VNRRHFVEKGYKPHARWVDDKTYADALDNFVLSCVDIILLNTKGEMLLGKRSYYPAKGWWIVGGRMTPGKSFGQAAARNIKRELGLRISPQRFSILGPYSFAWAIRRQPPAENGCHMQSTTMILNITDPEIALIKPNNEYEEIRWCNPTLVAKDKNLLRAVRQYARDILAQRK
jgi:8-oxo-dGTP diphosphatase